MRNANTGLLLPDKSEEAPPEMSAAAMELLQYSSAVAAKQRRMTEYTLMPPLVMSSPADAASTCTFDVGNTKTIFQPEKISQQTRFQAPESPGLTPYAPPPDAVVLDYARLLKFLQEMLVQPEYGFTAVKQALKDVRISTLSRIFLLTELGMADPISSIDTCLKQAPTTELLLRRNYFGQTLIDLVLVQDKVDWLQPLLHVLGPEGIRDYRNDSGESLFFAACASGKACVVAYLLSSGLVPVEEIHQEGPFRGETPMFRALYDNHLDVVRLLLRYRPDMTRVTDEGLTCLAVLHLQCSDDMFLLLHQHQFWSRARLILYARRKELKGNIFAQLPGNVIYKILKLLQSMYMTSCKQFVLPL